MKGGLLLDIVVGEGAAIFELLASEDQTLLVGGNALLVLNLGLDIVDGVAGLNLEGDSLASEGLDDCGSRLALHHFQRSEIRYVATYRFAFHHADGEPSEG